MFSLYSWLFPTPPTPLEIDAYPHIVDGIVEAADLSSLLALRQTCRGMKALVDARFAHIVAGPDGSLRAVPRRPSPSAEEQFEGVDIAPMVDAWCRSVAGGRSWFRPRTVKPFIFCTARQIDRYHCPGQAMPGASPPTPCSGEGEDGCPCSCAPVRGLVHFDRLEAIREWRCPEEEAEGVRTPIGTRWNLDKHLSSLYALRPSVTAA